MCHGQLQQQANTADMLAEVMRGGHRVTGNVRSSILRLAPRLRRSHGVIFLRVGPLSTSLGLVFDLLLGQRDDVDTGTGPEAQLRVAEASATGDKLVRGRRRARKCILLVAERR